MTALTVWFRIVLEDQGAVGPGKADLLAAVDRSGSISAAGRELGMSYRRAWRLADALNGLFGTPLIEGARGGERGGGSRLTPAGRRVLDIYRGLQRELDRAAAPFLSELDAVRGAP